MAQSAEWAIHCWRPAVYGAEHTLYNDVLENSKGNYALKMSLHAVSLQNQALHEAKSNKLLAEAMELKEKKAAEVRAEHKREQRADRERERKERDKLFNAMMANSSAGAGAVDMQPAPGPPAKTEVSAEEVATALKCFLGTNETMRGVGLRKLKRLCDADQYEELEDYNEVIANDETVDRDLMKELVMVHKHASTLTTRPCALRLSVCLAMCLFTGMHTMSRVCSIGRPSGVVWMPTAWR